MVSTRCILICKVQEVPLVCSTNMNIWATNRYGLNWMHHQLHPDLAPPQILCGHELFKVKQLLDSLLTSGIIKVFCMIHMTRARLSELQSRVDGISRKMCYPQHFFFCGCSLNIHSTTTALSCKESDYDQL